jgi:hypothetical protein
VRTGACITKLNDPDGRIRFPGEAILTPTEACELKDQVKLLDNGGQDYLKSDRTAVDARANSISAPLAASRV